MRILHKLILASAFLFPLAGYAQNAIDMSSFIDDATVELIGDVNAASLRNKISKIITRCGMADAEGLFAVVPSVFITDDGEVDTGMSTVRVIKADLTLSVRNMVDNTVFASQTVPLQATGNSDAACMRSLVNKVNVNDVRFAKMLKDVQVRIAEYYTKLLPRIMTKVDSYVGTGQYDEALAALAMVPECVEGYAEVSEKKVEVYRKSMENKVVSVLAEADMLARKGDIDGAFELCRGCSPLSPNYSLVLEFLDRVDKKKAAAEKAAFERKMMEIDAAGRKEALRVEATSEGNMLKAEYSGQAKGKRKSIGAVLLGL